MSLSPFAALERYTDPRVHQVFNQITLVRFWLTLLDLLAAVRSQPRIPSTFLTPTDNAAAEQMTLALLVDWRDREAQTGHDVAALLDVARERWGSHLGAGLTSSNLVDFGLTRSLTAVRPVLTATADAVIAELTTWPQDGRVLARTHGRPARVTTMGRIGLVHADRFQSAVRGLREADQRLLVLNLGGPIGDYTTGIDLQTAEQALTWVRKASGQDWTLGTVQDQALDRGRFRDWVQAAANLVTECAQFAMQVRLRARDGEWAEPTGVDPATYTGSSSMPYKRNPTRAERVCGLERVVRGLAGSMAESVVWWDQRDISASSVERVVLPQIAHYAAFCLSETYAIAAGLEVDRTAVEADLARLTADEARSGSAQQYAAGLLQPGDVSV